MRIDAIKELNLKCTGCMSCIDACPVNCIESYDDNEGFKLTRINNDKCIDCGKCYSICPIENKKENKGEQHLFAAYSKDSDIQNRGSSGGMFELLANYCLEQGFYICGAMFKGTKLVHDIINSKEELKPLLKSKYIQSNIEGVYKKVYGLLKNNEKVFFCGTPCQVSALQNLIPDNYKNNLLTADIICHGVPSQKMFDMYIDSLEKKYKGKVTEYSFRVKDNKFKHAHGCMFKFGKSEVNSIYTKESFYNAFKNYEIFRESCYDCKYATLNRVSDITLADFWGIEKYDFNANVDKGISMVITNTAKGYQFFDKIEQNIEHKEFPIEYGIESNYCLTNSTKKPNSRDVIFSDLNKFGYDYVANKYFNEGFKFKIYWLIPVKLRNLIRKIRG